MKRKLVRWARRIGIGLLLAGVILIGCIHLYVRYGIVDMPGASYKGSPSSDSEATRELSTRLKNDVDYLANELGPRSIYNADKLDETRSWIEDRFAQIGLQPKIQSYHIDSARISKAVAARNEFLKNQGRTDFVPQYEAKRTKRELANVWVEIKGRKRPDQLLIVGAHYDTATPGCPGADDNSSGVAGLLEIARYLEQSQNGPAMDVWLVAFTCEEHPVASTDLTGSAVFARKLIEDRNGPAPLGMISLEMLGYYSDKPGSQKYPPPFNIYFPNTANFIGFVGDSSSRDFIRSVIRQFRRIPAKIPSEGIAAPVWLVPDVLRSDHGPFVQIGVPALMVTDTSNFRYADHYHQATDTPDKLDFTRMAYLVDALSKLIERFES